jgi:hypothetical protein
MGQEVRINTDRLQTFESLQMEEGWGKEGTEFAKTSPGGQFCHRG